MFQTWRSPPIGSLDMFGSDAEWGAGLFSMIGILLACLDCAGVSSVHPSHRFDAIPPCQHSGSMGHRTALASAGIHKRVGWEG